MEEFINYLHDKEPLLSHSIQNCVGYILWYRFGEEFQRLRSDGGMSHLPVWTHPYACKLHAKAVATVRRHSPHVFQFLGELIKGTCREVVRFRVEKVGFSISVVSQLKQYECEGYTFHALLKKEVEEYRANINSAFAMLFDDDD